MSSLCVVAVKNAAVKLGNLFLWFHIFSVICVGQHDKWFTLLLIFMFLFVGEKQIMLIYLYSDTVMEKCCKWMNKIYFAHIVVCSCFCSERHYIFAKIYNIQCSVFSLEISYALYSLTQCLCIVKFSAWPVNSYLIC